MINAIPWTRVVMDSTYEHLFEYVYGKIPFEDDGRFTNFLEKWAKLNHVRAMFPLLGGILGLIALIN